MMFAGSPVHTVIFDLDGTLSDSARLTLHAFRIVAPVFAIPMPDEEAIMRATGYANPEFYRILCPDIDPDTLKKMGDMVEATELKILPDMGKHLLFPDCRELLDCLKNRGIRLYIASTGDREHVYSVLRETGITGMFDQISCGVPDKIEMLRSLTADGDREGYIMIGDMKKDSEGARANGILSAGACFGYCRRELTSFDYYLDKPFDLIQLIGVSA